MFRLSNSIAHYDLERRLLEGDQCTLKRPFKNSKESRVTKGRMSSTYDPQTMIHNSWLMSTDDPQTMLHKPRRNIQLDRDDPRTKRYGECSAIFSVSTRLPYKNSTPRCQNQRHSLLIKSHQCTTTTTTIGAPPTLGATKHFNLARQV